MPPTTRQNCTCQSCQEAFYRLTKDNDQLWKDLLAHKWCKIVDKGRIKKRDAIIERQNKVINNKNVKLSEADEEMQQLRRINKELTIKIEDQAELLNAVDKLRKEENHRIQESMKPRCLLTAILKKTDKSWKPLALKFINPPAALHDVFVIGPDGKEIKVAKEGTYNLTKALLEEGEKLGHLSFQVYQLLRDHSTPGRTAETVKKFFNPIVVPILSPEEFITVRKMENGDYYITMDNSNMELEGITFQKSCGGYIDYGNDQKQANVLPKKKIILIARPSRSNNILLLKLKCQQQPSFSYSVTTKMPVDTLKQ